MDLPRIIKAVAKLNEKGLDSSERAVHGEREHRQTQRVRDTRAEITAIMERRGVTFSELQLHIYVVGTKPHH